MVRSFFPPTKALFNGTDESDEMKRNVGSRLRALRPKTSCLTLDVTETLS